MKYNIVFPVLNEERRITKGLLDTVKFMECNFKDEYIITIMDNGSIDRTEDIALEICKQYDTIHYVKIKKRGVGVAFREAVKNNKCDIIGYMDIDLSTDLKSLLDMKRIFEQTDVQIVNASRYEKKSKIIGRKLLRTITSNGLRWMLKIILGMKSNDAICGFKFFRKDVITDLVKKSSDRNGWFYCIELLLRAEQMGIKIRDIPVVWVDNYDSHVNVPKLIKSYLIGIYELFVEFKLRK